jgi:3,4-dihydroxy 2-butanone 4-phosphate synthase / GTP cyclohydrolase II
MQFVIAVDDENGEYEGDLIMAATLVKPQDIAFMIRHGSGIISVGMKEEDLQRLMIPMMSSYTEIEDIAAAASTVTVVTSQLICFQLFGCLLIEDILTFFF